MYYVYIQFLFFSSTISTCFIQVYEHAWTKCTKCRKSLNIQGPGFQPGGGCSAALWPSIGCVVLMTAYSYILLYQGVCTKQESESELRSYNAYISLSSTEWEQVVVAMTTWRNMLDQEHTRKKYGWHCQHLKNRSIVKLQANALLLTHGAARVALLTHQTAVLAHPSNSYDWCPLVQDTLEEACHLHKSQLWKHTCSNSVTKFHTEINHQDPVSLSLRCLRCPYTRWLQWLYISQDTKCLTAGPSSAMADLSSEFGVIARERPTLLLQ